MAVQIALAWNDACAAELARLGFEKREVYMKQTPWKFDQKPGEGLTDAQCRAGEAEFFAMRNKPFQFVATSYWGAGVD